MGRPPSRPVKLKEGYYIEIKAKGSNSGTKIRRETEFQIKQAMKLYEDHFEIVYLGKLKNGKFENEKK